MKKICIKCPSIECYIAHTISQKTVSSINRVVIERQNDIQKCYPQKVREDVLKFEPHLVICGNFHGFEGNVFFKCIESITYG